LIRLAAPQAAVAAGLGGTAAALHRRRSVRLRRWTRRESRCPLRRVRAIWGHRRGQGRWRHWRSPRHCLAV